MIYSNNNNNNNNNKKAFSLFAYIPLFKES